MSGTVFLVGAGPGAPDLLTLRAARLLERADIVFHDALVPPAILSLASRAEKIEVGKRSGRHSTAQAFINKRLADAARTHQVVVRLKGGDPLLFGRSRSSRMLPCRGCASSAELWRSCRRSPRVAAMGRWRYCWARSIGMSPRRR